MSKKGSRSIKSPPASEQVQLQLNDGCGCLEYQSEVEVEITVKRRSDGGCIGSTRGLFMIYPFETSPGWYRLVSRTFISLGKDGR